MAIRTTPTMIVVEYDDYSQGLKSGPANVYYSIADFQKSAKHYGWGNVSPSTKVRHMGASVAAFEALHGALRPVRVRYL